MNHNQVPYYTELNSNLIYEVKFFDGFVIARPCSPAYYKNIKKLPSSQFAVEFEEFMGDPEPVTAFLHEMEPNELTVL